MLPNRLSISLASLFGWLPASAQAAASGIDRSIADAFQPIADAVAGFVFHTVPIAGYPVPWILFWLILIALYCTAYFRLINLRGMAQGYRLIRGDYAEPGHSGETSHFQALSTALSGTVGLGNIAGVAAAVAVGGPGATFWMIVAALLGMATKFCECTLGVMYRREHADGSVSGGPMYYLRDGIAANYPRLAPLGRVLGAAFAVLCVFGVIGSAGFFQTNQAYQQVLIATGGEASFLAGRAWLFAAIMIVAVGIVIVGGIRRIARVADKLVPAMALLYLAAGLTVIGTHLDQVPTALVKIVTGAFTPEGVQGGVLGAILIGFRRAAFSNEAGIGNAAIAHSSVRTSEPLTEGLVALWEPFIDTVVICTMTGLVIVVTGAVADNPSVEGVRLTSAAFASVLPWFPYVLAVVVLLFAYSTVIAYYYYGAKAASYLFGDSRWAEHAFKLVFLGAMLIGVTIDFDRLVDFADAMYFLMAVPNVIGLYLLAPAVRREMHGYFGRLQRGQLRSRRRAEQGAPA